MNSNIETQQTLARYLRNVNSILIADIADRVYYNEGDDLLPEILTECISHFKENDSMEIAFKPIAIIDFHNQIRTKSKLYRIFSLD
ncbi:MAG: hypothetical protein ACOYNC_00980 [Bacteroidales bacterium]